MTGVSISSPLGWFKILIDLPLIVGRNPTSCFSADRYSLAQYLAESDYCKLDGEGGECLKSKLSARILSDVEIDLAVSYLQEKTTEVTGLIIVLARTLVNNHTPNSIAQSEAISNVFKSKSEDGNDSLEEHLTGHNSIPARALKNALEKIRTTK
jgi:hypothetical protein